MSGKGVGLPGEDLARRPAQSNGIGPARFPDRAGPTIDGDEAGGGLREYLAVVYDQRRVIALTFLLVTVAVVIYVLTRTPLYTATVTIQIDRENPNILSFKDVTPSQVGWGAYDEYTQTQLSILKSQALAAKVVKQLNLIEDPRFKATGERRVGLSRAKEALVSALARVFSTEPRSEVPPPAETSLLGVDGEVVDAFLAGVAVKRIPETRLVAVSYTSEAPNLSATVANGIAQGYKAYSLETRFDLSNEASDFLEKQLHDLEERVRASEAALDRFRQSSQILSLEPGENSTLQKLQQLNQMVTTAEAESSAKEAQFNLVKNGASDSLPAVLASPLIVQLKERVADLEREYGRLSKKFLPGYPQMEQLESQMSEARASLARETSRIAQGVDREYRAARDTEQSLRAQLGVVEKEALAQKTVSVEYMLLKREVDTNRQLHDSILQRMKETTVAAALKTGNVRVVDPARVPTSRSYPRRTQTTLIGMLVGLMIALGVAFLRSYLSELITTPELASRVLGLPSLALVPVARTGWRSWLARWMPVRALGQGGNGSIRQVPLPTRADPRYPVELVMVGGGGTPTFEAYRTLATSLLLSNADRPPRSILFTSSLAGEGKTSTAINTSLALAQGGKQVILLDADLRRPRIHKVLGIPNSRGLSTFLQGDPNLKNMAMSVLHENLWVVPGGPVPPDPYGLLVSGRIADVIRQLSERFDFVVIDSCPVLPVADALLLSNMVEGVILVVDSSRTSREVVRAGQDRLLRANAKLLGVLLNKVDTSRRYTYRHYRHYFSSYYGRESEREHLEGGQDVEHP